MTRTISLQARRLSILAGLGDLIHQPPCHGFACCCNCPACTQTDELVAEHREHGRNPFTDDGTLRPKPAPAQPWANAA